MMRDAAAWSPLLPVAMVGTERHAAPPPQWPGPVGAAIAALADAAPTAAEAAGVARAPSDVLRTAGVLAVCGLAGTRALPRVPGASPAAGADTLPAVDGAALLQALDWTLADGPHRLKQEFLVRLARGGLRLPHALLPTALELARSTIALRALVQPVLGERGVWLARQRDDWRFAAGVVAVDELDPRQWDHGTLEQRAAFLAAERAREPRAARERLGATLSELPAKERAELARGLAVGLGPDDEPLLDQLRGDRGQEVRSVALALLLRLPDAAHPRRAAARIAALMSRGDPLAPADWAIDAPSEVGTDWKADQIEPDLPVAKLGQRAAWLYRLVCQVPLPWWTAHTGLTPRELLAWSRRTDWADALWLGWRDVLMRAPRADWAELLLQDDVQGMPGDRDFALAVVSPAVREQWILRELASPEALLQRTLVTVFSGCEPGETIPAALCAPIVQRVRRALAHDAAADPGVSNVHLVEQVGAGHALPDLCCTLPLTFLADFDAWAESPGEWPAIARARHAGRQIIQARRVLASRLA